MISVEAMSTSAPWQRLPYDDPSTPHEMYGDCEAVGANLHLPRHRAVREPRPAHPEPRYSVPDSTAALAGNLHLHLS